MWIALRSGLWNSLDERVVFIRIEEVTLVCQHSFPSIVTFSRVCSSTLDSCELTILLRKNGCCVAIRYFMEGTKICEWHWNITWSKNASSIIAD